MADSKKSITARAMLWDGTECLRMKGLLLGNALTMPNSSSDETLQVNKNMNKLLCFQDRLQGMAAATALAPLCTGYRAPRQYFFLQH